MYHPFSVAETLKSAWNVLKKNIVTLIVYSVISLIFNRFADFLSAFVFFTDNKITQLVLIFCQMVVQAYVGISFYKLILTLIDKQYYEFSFKDILPSFKMILNFVIIAFIAGIIILLLLLINTFLATVINYPRLLEVIELLLVLYLSLRAIFCLCFIVDDDSGPIESLKQSFSITKDNFFKTLWIFAIIILYMLIMLIPFVVLINLLNVDPESGESLFKLSFYLWFILTFPFVQVIIMVTYRKLVYSHQDVDDDIAETN
jgi:hypothetical protein